MLRLHRAVILVTLFSCIAVLKAQELSDKEIEEYVDSHNSFRSGVEPEASNMKKMSYAANLADLATEWASRCKFEHGNPPNDYDNIGQNIFMTSERDGIATDGPKLFYDEVANYDLDSNSCEPGKICGHYTQLVWANSSNVGCGVSPQCPDGNYIFVCNYYPAGNWEGEQPYEAGSACSDCDDVWDGCENNLCESD